MSPIHDPLGQYESQSMTELESLRAELTALTNARNKAVEAAKKMIAEANRRYDDEAFPLARRIKRLEPVPEAEPTAPVVTRTRSRTVSLEGTEDWSHEERDHYRKLAQATRKG